MERRDDAGHEPEETHDETFAPVTRDSDAEGRTTGPGRPAGGTGTGVPGASSDHPDTLPPDSEGVAEAERTDDTG